jgi:Protein of unknown function (DUF3024)
MSFNELELKRIDRTVGELCRRSTRPERADQLRFECEIGGHTVSMWEVRPPWDGVGDETRMAVARFRFFRSRGAWQLCWMRRDLKWHRYEPARSTPDLAALVAIGEEAYLTQTPRARASPVGSVMCPPGERVPARRFVS